jgi:hypothetical protein
MLVYCKGRDSRCNNYLVVFRVTLALMCFLCGKWKHTYKAVAIVSVLLYAVLLISSISSEASQRYSILLFFKPPHTRKNIHSSVICQTHDRSTTSSKTIPPLNAI